MTWQLAIVLILVAASLTYLAWASWRSWRGGKSGCKSASASTTNDKLIPTEQLTLRRKA